MKKKLRYVGVGLVAIAVIGGVAFTQGSQAEASSGVDAGVPDMQIQLLDSHEHSPNLPGSCIYTSAWVGTGDGLAHLPRHQDTADCMKIRILNGSPETEYSKDFRFCLGLEGNYGCTPWASDGGGSALTNWFGHFKIAWASVQVRPMPIPTMKLTNVRASIQVYYQDDNGGCGASSGEQGSTGPESGIAWGGNRDNDPGCARIGLSVNQVLPPDAEFMSDTVPSTLGVSEQVTNASITMKNVGGTWASDTIVDQTDNCASFNEDSEEQECTDYTTYGSSRFQLKRIHAPDDGNANAPEMLPYRRVVMNTYRKAFYEHCEPIDPPGDVILTRSRWDNALHAATRWVVPEAFASIQPPIGNENCETVTYIRMTSTPVPNVAFGATASFPVSFTGPAQEGSYALHYRMEDLTGSSYCTTPGNCAFGEEAIVPFTVGTSQNYGFTCDTVDQTVAAGQTASYGVTANSLNGFNGNISIAVSGVPSGATSTGGTIALSSGGAGSTIIPVFTSTTTPAGASTLTFRASAQVGTSTVTHPCASQLNITGAAERFFVAPDSVSWNTTMSGEAPLNGVDLKALAFAGTGPTTYTFYCDSEDGGTDILANYVGRFEGVAGEEKIMNDACDYVADNTYHPKTIMERNGVLRAVRATVTVTADATLAAGLDISRDGTTWVSSLSSATSIDDVDMRGIATGGTGTMNFTFYCNRSDAGTNITPGYDHKIDGTSVNPQIAGSICDYAAPASGSVTYTPKVIIERGGAVAEARGSVTIAAVPGVEGCNFTTSPTALFIPPPRSTTLTWNCDHPTSCTVTNQTDPPFAQVATGNQNGSGQASPRHSTTYRLSCDSGNTIIDKLVRVFDVTTRIEILPR